MIRRTARDAYKKHLFDFMIAMIITMGLLIAFGIVLLVTLTGHTWLERIRIASEAIVPGLIGIVLAVKAYMEVKYEA